MSPLFGSCLPRCRCWKRRDSHAMSPTDSDSRCLLQSARPRRTRNSLFVPFFPASLFVLLVAGPGAVLVFSQLAPPNYSVYKMPDTAFDCRNKVVGGYYADPEAHCQMFHVCVQVGPNEVRDFRFLCPNDTVFDQKNFICANWWEVECGGNPAPNNISSSTPRPTPRPASSPKPPFDESLRVKTSGEKGKKNGTKAMTTTTTNPTPAPTEYDYLYYEELPPSEYDYEYVDSQGNAFPSSQKFAQLKSGDPVTSSSSPRAPTTHSRSSTSRVSFGDGISGSSSSSGPAEAGPETDPGRGSGTGDGLTVIVSRTSSSASQHNDHRGEGTSTSSRRHHHHQSEGSGRQLFLADEPRTPSPTPTPTEGPSSENATDKGARGRKEEADRGVTALLEDTTSSSADTPSVPSTEATSTGVSTTSEAASSSPFPPLHKFLAEEEKWRKEADDGVFGSKTVISVRRSQSSRGPDVSVAPS